jgi:hypothetical protein
VGLGEVAKLIGKERTFKTAEGLSIRVRVLDARQSYGRTELLVEPVTGSGQAWVTAKRVASK